MRSTFLTTAEIEEVVQLLQNEFYEGTFDSNTARFLADDKEIFVAIRQANYTGSEGFWICRYDHDFVQFD